LPRRPKRPKFRKIGGVAARRFSLPYD